MMSPSLEDQECHLLVKVIDRILFKLDTQVAPYAHKILITVMPMLTDENSYARIEGREIISNLTKSAGLATMISVMRPDIDSPDENIRLVTSKAFAVVASSLGLNTILPFLKASIKYTRYIEFISKLKCNMNILIKSCFLFKLIIIIILESTIGTNC